MSRVFVHFRSPAVIFRFIVNCASFLNFVGLFFMTTWRVLKFKMKEAISNDGGDMRICIKVRLRG
jgi:hypothetical protein